MKTLVNKNNPAIRITAPEIEVQEESEMYLIPVSDYCIPMCIYDWTLVEEESKHTEVWVEGRTIFEQDAKSQEVDLEKEIDACWRNWLSPSNRNEVEEVLPKTEFAMYARHFYELGLKARKEE